MKRVFLVHGWDGTPDNHWFPWLAHQLVERGFTVFAPAMPNAAHPKASEWLAELARVVGEVDKDTYFVGHSLGCIATVRFLASLAEGDVAGGCVFVGGFSGNVRIKELSEFYSLPLVMGNVKKHAYRFVSIASDDDEAVPVQKSRDFNSELGGKFIEEKGKGHFCFNDGVTELPSVLSALLEMSSPKTKRKKP